MTSFGSSERNYFTSFHRRCPLGSNLPSQYIRSPSLRRPLNRRGDITVLQRPGIAERTSSNPLILWPSTEETVRGSCLAGESAGLMLSTCHPGKGGVLLLQRIQGQARGRGRVCPLCLWQQREFPVSTLPLRGLCRGPARQEVVRPWKGRKNMLGAA